MKVLVRKFTNAFSVLLLSLSDIDFVLPMDSRMKFEHESDIDVTQQFDDDRDLKVQSGR